VWQAPTSCAWAARVYVSDADARSHGRRACGLPSAHAAFAPHGAERGRPGGWWQAGEPGAARAAGARARAPGRPPAGADAGAGPRASQAARRAWS